MLHEIIITLYSGTGRLLQNDYEHVDLKTFLHPSEIELLEELWEITRNYKMLLDFVNTNRFPDSIGWADGVEELRTKPGLYIQAYCEGLDAVLNPYREALISLEEDILSSTVITLLHVYTRVYQFSSLINIMRNTTLQIIGRKLHGCRILQHLHETLSLGEEVGRSAMRSIQKYCHRELYKQVVGWVLYGNITDPYNEFFIKKMIKSNEDKKNISSLIDESNEFEDYEISVDLIPSYIKYSLVKEMLFVGQNMLILKADQETGILFENDEKLFENFVELKNSPKFNLEKFSEAIHGVRDLVVEHLWKLAIEKENLYKKLGWMRAVYLLGNGDLFNEFLKRSRKLFYSKSQNKFYVQEYEVAFQEAAEIVNIDENVVEEFHFVYQSVETADENSSVKYEHFWNSVKLEHLARWPLSLLFTKEIIKCYNKLFMFLLRIKRCIQIVSSIWLNDMKQPCKQFEMKHKKLSMDLRFFLKNLYYYLQVDVIESHYNTFMQKVKTLKDFQEIQKCHQSFIMTLLTESFIFVIQDRSSYESDIVSTSKPTQAFHKANVVIMNLVRLSESFCVLSNTEGSNGSSKYDKLKQLETSFNNHKQLLACLLSTLQTHPSQQYVTKLYDKLNYHYWLNV